ncbi:MAG: NAD(P)/FAD-dependent oxidoreductase [Gaiellaceae bacterium]
MGSHGDPDVLVIGGGPAGCATAIFCRRAGLHVRLIARPDRGRERPGEALLPGTEPLLRQLGVDRPVLDAGFLRHPGHWVQWDGERRFEPYGQDGSGPWLGFQAWRAAFDEILRAEACRAGVIVQRSGATAPLAENGRIAGVLVDRQAIRAKVVVDAAGARHWLARRLRLPIVRVSPRLLAWYAYLEGDCPRHDDCPTIAGDTEGWTWLARVRQGVYQWVRMPLAGGHVERTWCPPEFAELTRTGPARGADVTWRQVPASAGAGYFIAGDAAMVLDPLSSHGVLKALMSGMMAGDLIAKMLRRDLSPPIAARRYRSWQAAWFARDTQALRALYASLPNPPAWATESQTAPSGAIG